MRGPPAKATVLPEAEAEAWSGELDAWATVQEKLDNPDAREARLLADEIRALAQEVKDARTSADWSTTGILLETLGTLRARAIRILHPR